MLGLYGAQPGQLQLRGRPQAGRHPQQRFPPTGHQGCGSGSGPSLSHPDPDQLIKKSEDQNKNLFGVAVFLQLFGSKLGKKALDGTVEQESLEGSDFFCCRIC